MTKYFKFLFLFCAINTSLLYAQQITPNQLKSVMLYKIAQNIEWENELNFKQFTIGVVSEDGNLKKTMTAAFVGKTIKNIPIVLKIIENENDAKDLQLVYFSDFNSIASKKIVANFLNTKPLFITDNVDDKRIIMINLFSENDQIKFEVNKSNIVLNKMKIGPKLLLLGGTEIDVAQLYKDTEDNLSKEKVKAKQQEEQLGVMKKDIDKKKQELEEQKKEMLVQQEQINEQKKQIDEQKTVFKALTDNVVLQQKLLADKVLQAEAQTKMIHEQESSLKVQQAEMQTRTEKLHKLTGDIDAQQDKISDQKLILAKQGTQIKIQQNLIFVFGFFGLLIAALAFFIFRGLQIQKKFNKQLGEKNAQIAQQSAMLEREKEQTLNSIKYAKTIQEAVLPHIEGINKYVQTFVVFKPKDIVSGDFFWFHTIAATNNSPEKIFIAAVDSTGHGVPGAFMSMIGTSLLNQIVKEKDIYSPCEILEQLHTQIKMALKQGKSDNNDGMDACFCLLEKYENGTTKLTFSGAKRSLYYIKPNQPELLQLKADRKSIGGAIQKVREVDFTNQIIELPKDTLIYLTTDGYADQNNAGRMKFGLRRLENLLLSMTNDTIHIQKNKVENALAIHQGNQAQRDDITIIGIKL